MFGTILVEDIMDNPVFVKFDDNYVVVVKRLLETKKGYVLVLKHNELSGIITDRDIQRLILKEGGIISPDTAANDFMVSPVITITKSASLEEAEDLMREHKISLLPVIEGKNPKKVIGIINFTTIHYRLLSGFAKKWVQRYK